MGIVKRKKGKEEALLLCFFSWGRRTHTDTHTLTDRQTDTLGAQRNTHSQWQNQRWQHRQLATLVLQIPVTDWPFILVSFTLERDSFSGRNLSSQRLVRIVYSLWWFLLKMGGGGVLKMCVSCRPSSGKNQRRNQMMSSQEQRFRPSDVPVGLYFTAE